MSSPQAATTSNGTGNPSDSDESMEPTSSDPLSSSEEEEELGEDAEGTQNGEFPTLIEPNGERCSESRTIPFLKGIFSPNNLVRLHCVHMRLLLVGKQGSSSENKQILWK